MFNNPLQQPEGSPQPDVLPGQAAAVFEFSNDAIIAKSLDGTILNWNPAAERMFGFPVNEAVGSPISILVPPDRAFEEPEMLARLAQGERIDHLTTVRIRKDGKRVHVCLTATPLKDSDGRVLGSTEIARDITEQKHAEAKARLHQERLNVMLSSIGDAVIVTDVSGFIEFLNPVAASLTGWKQEEARGQPLESVFNVINESTRCRVESPASRALREGVVVGIANHTVLITRSGGEVAIDDSAAPIRDGNGNTSGVILVFRDVSGARAVENIRARLSAIVEGSEDAIVGKDLHGRINSWNKGAERIFGYSQQEAIGRSITMLIPPDRLREEEVILSRLRRGERIEHFETIRLAKDRRKVEVSVTVSPMCDSEGKVVGASKIARDISDRKRSERELAEAHENLRKHAENLEDQVRHRTAELRASLEELETFSSSLSHDLKAPLRSIAGYTQSLSDNFGGQLPEAARELLGKTINACGRLSRLVDGVLAYARLGGPRIQLRKVELNDLVSRLLGDGIQEANPEAEIQVEYPLLPVVAHEEMLAQAVSNLISNALKFVAPGCRPYLRLWTELRNDQKVRLWVEDRGIGIPDEDQLRVFGLFTRLRNAGSYEGTGVGLAVVQRAAHRMGGEAGVLSGIEKGSRFWVELPNPASASLEPTVEKTSPAEKSSDLPR